MLIGPGAYDSVLFENRSEIHLGHLAQVQQPLGPGMMSRKLVSALQATYSFRNSSVYVPLVRDLLLYS